MKIFAGGRLCHKKPSNDPITTNNNPATNNCGFAVAGSGVVSITADIPPAMIAATPPLRPSMLSSMLNELMTATIQMTDRQPVNQDAAMNAVNENPKPKTV